MVSSSRLDNLISLESGSSITSETIAGPGFIPKSPVNTEAETDASDVFASS